MLCFEVIVKTMLVASDIRAKCALLVGLDPTLVTQVTL